MKNRKGLRKRILSVLFRDKREVKEELDRLDLRMCREALRLSKKKRGDYVV